MSNAKHPTGPPQEDPQAVPMTPWTIPQDIEMASMQIGPLRRVAITFKSLNGSWSVGFEPEAAEKFADKLKELAFLTKTGIEVASEVPPGLRGPNQNGNGHG